MGKRHKSIRDCFISSIVFQRASTELVVYCPTVGQVVTVAWPVRQGSQGVRIQEGQLREWLRRRGLHLACFCPLISEVVGHSTSSQIVHCRNGTVKAFCSSFPPKCGFYLDLTRLRRTALLTSEYAHLPTLASGRLPDLENIVTAFRSSRPFEEGPYFEGYFGEHVSQHLGLEQKAGVFVYHGPTIVNRLDPYPINREAVHARQRAIMDLESATFRIIADAVSRQQHSQRLATSPALTRIKRKPKPDHRELDAITKICRGEGVSAYDFQGLLEQCGRCEKYFTATVLRSHIPRCSQYLL